MLSDDEFYEAAKRRADRLLNALDPSQQDEALNQIDWIGQDPPTEEQARLYLKKKSKQPRTEDQSSFEKYGASDEEVMDSFIFGKGERKD